MGFRGLEVGTDVLQYNNDFDIYATSGLVFSVEPFWYYLNASVIYFGGEFRHVLIVSSVLILLPIYVVVWKKSEYPFLSLFFFIGLYYYCNSFNAVRQFIGVSLSMYAFYRYVMDSQKLNLKTGLIFLSAVLFHYSSLIWIPCLFLARLLRKFSTSLQLFVFVSYLLGSFLADFVIRLAVVVTGYEIELLNIWGNMATGLVLILIFLLINYSIKVKDNLFYIFCSFVILSNLLIRIPYGYRLVLFVGIFQILLFSNLSNNLNMSVSDRKIVRLILIIYAILNMIYYLSLNFGDVVPYYFENL